MITTDITQNILLDPFKSGCDELCILSAYATPQMASWLLNEFSKRKHASARITLLIGMPLYDGLSKSIHEGFKGLHSRYYVRSNVTISCGYICEGSPIHTNLYVWLKGNMPLSAFVGSAEFLQRTFIQPCSEDSLEKTDPQKALAYFRNAESRSIYCNHSEVENFIRIVSKHPILDSDPLAGMPVAGESVEKAVLPLISKRCNDVGKRSGLNWGQRHKRNQNEAYLTLPAQIARSGFFPLGGQHFTVRTDDNHYLILRVEQQGDKALTTPQSNALLGEYFRQRLKLANGAFITKVDLEQYGRTDVTFLKIDDEQFFMDFSPTYHFNVGE